MIDQHAGHDITNLTAARPDGPVGRRVCLTCDEIVGQLVLCGQKTKEGKPCRVAVRTDLGHTSCWSHGLGRGRTNTPLRERPDPLPPARRAARRKPPATSPRGYGHFA